MTEQKHVNRRQALGLMAGIGAMAVTARSSLAQPAVRKKVDIDYWIWSDNPDHRQRLVTAVDAFNRSQGFINVNLDADSRVAEVRQKVVAAYAAGAAPDVAGSVQTHVQDYHNTGILHPIDEFFQQWDEKDDFYRSMLDAMRSKDGQPVLYLATMLLPYLLYYRADWFDEAKVAARKSGV